MELACVVIAGLTQLADHGRKWPDLSFCWQAALGALIVLIGGSTIALIVRAAIGPGTYSDESEQRKNEATAMGFAECRRPGEDETGRLARSVSVEAFFDSLNAWCGAVLVFAPWLGPSAATGWPRGCLP
jgi:hypothetical protein